MQSSNKSDNAQSSAGGQAAAPAQAQAQAQLARALHRTRGTMNLLQRGANGQGQQPGTNGVVVTHNPDGSTTYSC